MLSATDAAACGTRPAVGRPISTVFLKQNTIVFDEAGPTAELTASRPVSVKQNTIVFAVHRPPECVSPGCPKRPARIAFDPPAQAVPALRANAAATHRNKADSSARTRTAR